MKRPVLMACVVVALLALASTAVACPVCFAPKNEENRVAFISMTVFLTLLPLGLIGLGVWWYKKRLREFNRRLRAERRASRRRRLAQTGRLFKAPQGYFERGYAGTPKAR